MIVLFEFKPYASIPLHDHVEGQTNIVLKVGGNFEIGEEIYHVREKTAYHKASGVSHRVERGENGAFT